MASILSLFLLSSCGPRPTQTTASDDFHAGILGGQTVTPADPVAGFTVGLYDHQNGSTCTASLIAPDLLLTAAHCVNPQSGKLEIYFSKEIKGRGLKALSFQRHPRYNPRRVEGENTYDLALVRFEGKIPQHFKPLKLSKDSNPVFQKSSEFRAAGFGVNRDLLGMGSGLLRTVSLKFQQLHSETEIQTEQGAQGVCSGDSGGPLVIHHEGQWVQVGVASRVATKLFGCRGFAVYTRVDRFHDWILSTSQSLRE